MEPNKITIERDKKIARVAHDNKKNAISSPLMDEEYDRLLPAYDGYRNQKLIDKTLD